MSRQRERVILFEATDSYEGQLNAFFHAGRLFQQFAVVCMSRLSQCVQIGTRSQHISL